MQFLQDEGSGGLFAMLKHTLNDAAAVWMSSQALDLASECIDDELYVFCGYALDSFLDDVIAILILDTLEDLILEFLDQ